MGLVAVVPSLGLEGPLLSHLASHGQSQLVCVAGQVLAAGHKQVITQSFNLVLSG
jgi:hypothetical protein